jgi:hypothetical protein
MKAGDEIYFTVKQLFMFIYKNSFYCAVQLHAEIAILFYQKQQKQFFENRRSSMKLLQTNQNVHLYN